MSVRCGALLLSSTILVMLSRGGFAQCQYEVTVVNGPSCGPLGYAAATARGMNEYGDVSGTYSSCSTGLHVPFLWTQQDGLLSLPILAGFSSALPLDINTSGKVVGSVSGDSPSVPVFWEDGQVYELDPGGPRGEAKGVNEEGIAVGWHYNEAASVNRAVRWCDGAAQELLLPLGPSSIAHDINDLGQVVGRMGDLLSVNAHPFIWHENGVADLGLLPGAVSGEALAINRRGWVVGNAVFRSKDGSYWNKGWLWRSGSTTVFEPRWDFRRAAAVDVNEVGQVIVDLWDHPAKPTTGAGFLWQDGTIMDLGELVGDRVGGHVGSPCAINDAGQIIMEQFDHYNGEFPFILLTPVGRPPGDLNIDCRTNVDDLLLVILHWNEAGSIADADGDGDVDIDDLLVVVLNWT